VHGQLKAGLSVAHEIVHVFLELEVGGSYDNHSEIGHGRHLVARRVR